MSNQVPAGPGEPVEYYGLLEDIVDADPVSGYSRSFFLFDCINAQRFRESDEGAFADRLALALVRAMSTPKRWGDLFGNLPKGDWYALTLDDLGDAPRAWELPAGRDYASGPARSLRSLRRLGDGTPAIAGSKDKILAFKLSAAAATFGLGGARRQSLHILAAELFGIGDGAVEIIALDVGQASASLIRRGGHSIGLFDAGAPIWFNKGSTPAGFIPPAITDGFIFLSHWDFDHFDLGRRHAPYRQLKWYAPYQDVGPNTARFQAELGSQLTFVDGGATCGGFTLARGTSTLPKDRNGSGYVLRYEKNGQAVLLTGDAGYDVIPKDMLVGLESVCIPHHAGRGADPPLPIQPHGRAVASYGLPNSYRHPHSDTISGHRKAGWEVISTAAGLLPRGNRPLYP